MPRYMVERSFPTGLHIPCNTDGAAACLNVVDENATGSVNWVQSFVSADKQKTFCLYDAPNPDAIRSAGERNGLPVGPITEVRVLDPFFYY
ncbi:DUF4242 domain-containing protein [Sphingomonas mali]|jgi:hypothetical protein|uniref:DUF4242 domain-containing protein n=1 Tax=Sphingomonas mali TaxID=40682 RepID=UPI0008335589|nr:DUF4242 domain-containing protein [Sphingomonas mali]